MQFALKPPFQNTCRMAPRFAEMNKVRVIGEEFEDSYEGYVIASLFRDGRWVYKISHFRRSNKHRSF